MRNRGVAVIYALFCVFIGVSALVDITRDQDEWFWPYALFTCAVYFFAQPLCRNSSSSNTSFSPWVYFPPLVVVYYLLEPALKISHLEADDPTLIAKLVFIFISTFLLGCLLVNVLWRRSTVQSVKVVNLLNLRRLAFLLFIVAFGTYLYVFLLLGFLPLRPDFEVVRTSLPRYITGYGVFAMLLAVPAGIILLSQTHLIESKYAKYFTIGVGFFALLLPLFTGNRTRVLAGFLVVLLSRWHATGRWPSYLKASLVVMFVVALLGVVGGIRLAS